MDKVCQHLEWDSRFFGLRIARILSEHPDRALLDAAMRWCEEQRIDCLYFLCAPDDDQSVTQAESAGFHLVDVRLELNWKVQDIAEPPASLIRQYQETDLTELQQIAAEVYTNTRFGFDRHFDQKRVAELYRQWVTQSCHNDEQKVFVVSPGLEPTGFITCQFDSDNVGRIGLLGLKREAMGKGYGQNLIQAAQQHFIQVGAQEVRVVTQGRNIAAQRLYQSCHFRTCKLGLWYHKWF
ncbi:MAG: GNAT family N-acetyltransferase [Acidobacteria bacterium]|nr:GNAT family N-acetyltransferase [Acidobacteriota bacterium]